MRTVKECRDEIEDINKLIKEKEVVIKRISEEIIDLRGAKAGIMWTFINVDKKKEEKNAIFRSKS